MSKLSEISGKFNDSEESEEFINIDKASDNLQKAYQIQVLDDGRVRPMYIGSYEKIPIVIHDTILYDQSKDIVLSKEKTINGKSKDIYRIHIVTFLLSEQSVKSGEYDLVGAVIMKNDVEHPTHSLILNYNTNKKKFRYIFNNYLDLSIPKIIEVLDKFPGKDKVLEDLVERVFQEPVKSVILS